jgi:uncharacterized protein (TIGR00375 family)
VKYIADLHIHSLFSRATSKSSNLPGLAAWAAVKGIDVLGTGDFTHPGWFRQLTEYLQPAEPGFFKLKDTNIPPALESVRPDRLNSCRFILSAEISSIYKRHGRVRKIHNVILVPDLESAARINSRLAGIGNIESDGRPILGLDARDLLEIVLELAPEGFLVPAHIWTPWFSLFGSKSGFDAIEECYGDLSSHIFALETGLSSDPDMNRLVSALDRFSLISNSDCHSPGKLGREANLFTCGFNFFSMRDALKKPAVGGFLGTIEFFPEEGKYHNDGHRKCDINLDPQQTRETKGICPVCGKPLTIGVLHRVLELADRDEPYYPANSPGFYSLIPLPEILSEILGKGPATKTVMSEYARLIKLFDSEFNLLMNVPVEDIQSRCSPVLAEAVQRIRNGKVIRQAGFDGEFGVIKVFEKGELHELVGQSSLFERKKPVEKKPSANPAPSLFKSLPEQQPEKKEEKSLALNREQEEAVNSEDRHIIVTAGPGTGKTFTLVARIKRILSDMDVSGRQVVAITFTNRAAEEMADRLRADMGEAADSLFIGTFHAFCLQWLRLEKPDLTVVGEKLADRILKGALSGSTRQDRKDYRGQLEKYYQALAAGDNEQSVNSRYPQLTTYLNELEKRSGIDISGVIPIFVHRLKTDESFCRKICNCISYLFVDEFQDLNMAQYELVRVLARSATVFAIGDPDQAIYGFRGSNPQFFFRFIDEFKARRISLTRNYRSAAKVIKAAGELISHNHDDSYSYGLIPQHSRAGVIELYHASSPQAEAEFVVRRIEELIGGISHFSIDTGRGGEKDDAGAGSFRDFAVLYRLGQQIPILTEALERRGIPFQVINVIPFFLQKEMRPVYYWIRTATDGGEGRVDSMEYLFLLQTLPGIGDSTLDVLEKELPFGGVADFFSLVQTVDIPKAVRNIIDDVREKLQEFRKQVAERGLHQSVLETMRYLRVNSNSVEAKRFLDLAGSFGADLDVFAKHLHSNVGGTVYDDKAEAVSLMSLHAAKGLEFPTVFITGLEDGILPCDLTGEGDTASGFTTMLAEERRLFYVGMTRAQDSLILSYAATRSIYGHYSNRPPSRFLKEISEDIVTEIEQDKSRRKKSHSKQMKLF